MSQRNGDMEPMRCAFAGVVLGQALAQAVGLDPHNGVGILIEGISSAEDLHANGILLDLAGLSGKELSHKYDSR